MILNFFSNPPSSLWALLVPFLGALIGAGIGAYVNFVINSRNQKTSLYVAVFTKKFEAAVKLMTEAEYLRRGLSEYNQQEEKDKQSFKDRWERQTSRELAFHAHQSAFFLGNEVKNTALSLEKVCRSSMDTTPDSSNADVLQAYADLQNALHKQTQLPELDKIFAEVAKK